jgi:putative phage-type endonuclease
MFLNNVHSVDLLRRKEATPRRVVCSKLSFGTKRKYADIPKVMHPVSSVEFKNDTISEELRAFESLIATARTSMEPVKPIFRTESHTQYTTTATRFETTNSLKKQRVSGTHPFTLASENTKAHPFTLASENTKAHPFTLATGNNVAPTSIVTAHPFTLATGNNVAPTSIVTAHPFTLATGNNVAPTPLATAHPFTLATGNTVAPTSLSAAIHLLPTAASFSVAESATTTNKLVHARPKITQEMQLDFIRKLWMTKEQIAATKLCEQRSPEWFAARNGRISGSIVSNITGENPFMRPDALLRDKLWGNFRGNEATRYGTWHEPVAEYVHTIACRKKDPASTLEFPGLVVSADRPWLSYSPDGIVHFGNAVSILAEYKCPFKKTFYKGKKPGEANIPIYYRSQIQFGMMLLDLPSCDFLVWTPTETRIERYNRDYAYCAWMSAKVSRFYFERYLPALIAKNNGWLPFNTTDVESVCDVTYITETDALRTKPVD